MLPLVRCNFFETGFVSLLFVAASISLGTCSIFAANAADKQSRPNIVLILADDLGYGDLGCYGQKRIQTPHIDELAREGMRFTDFYAGSTVCAPSRCVLMTGYHTGHAWIRGNSKQNLRPSDITVAQVVKASGYSTGLCGKWGLGHEGSEGVPTRKGFDYFFGYLDQHHAHNFYPSYLMKNEARFPLLNVVPGKGEFGSGVASEKKQYSHDLVTEEALAFVDRNYKQPFFLFIAWTTPHANNEAGKAGMEVPDYGTYTNNDWPEPQKGHAAMISRMDRDVGRLLARLKQYEIDDNTLVFFTSDNGPHREGGNDPDFNDSNGPLQGIKRSLTEGGIRVPMIARWPNKIQAGQTSDFVGSFQDMLPTFAELAAPAGSTTTLAVPKDCDGLSFAPTLLGRTSEQRQHDFLYWAFYEGGAGQALRQGNWKAVQQPFHSEIRLYDLFKDLGETTNIAAEHPKLVEKIKSQMSAAYVPSEKWTFPDMPSGAKKKRKQD